MEALQLVLLTELKNHTQKSIPSKQDGGKQDGGLDVVGHFCLSKTDHAYTKSNAMYSSIVMSECM